MKIEDVHYLSLEGGGGKGSVYLGAIKALEQKFHEEWKSGKLVKFQNGVLSEYNLPVGFVSQSKLRPTSILDYYSKYSDNKDPIIKGIAGSSAGAITAFPLALGLNSEDIESILKGYEFEKEFMSTKLHEGKYRMVGMDNDGKPLILVAEDKFKKLGASKIEVFNFDFVPAELNNRKKEEIGSNELKAILRVELINLIANVFISGIVKSQPVINRFFNQLKRWTSITGLISGSPNRSNTDPIITNFLNAWNYLFRIVISRLPVPFRVSNNLLITFSKLLPPIVIPWIPPLAQKRLGGFIQRGNIRGAVSNLIWDRGVYSGFEIREFFFRILLLAMSKDTHFRRRLLANEKLLREFGLSKVDLMLIEGCMVDFKLISNDKYNHILERLSKDLATKLNFQRLYEITGVNLCCCVSNSTSGQALYFSSYFTPNYPVIEALGASMSFPLAFKPVYNEANVLVDENFLKELTIQDQEFVCASKVKDSSSNLFKEEFSQNHFSKYQNVLLNYIKVTCELNFSLNANLSFRSFLPYLRAIIYKKDFKAFTYENAYSKEPINYSQREITFLCYFYYNAVFKGLHVDGGATNNLPISVHAYVDPKSGILDYKQLQDLEVKKKVLSLKLDNSFPQSLVDEIEKQIKPITDKYNLDLHEILMQVNEDTDSPVNPNHIGYKPIKNILKLRVKKIMKQQFKTDLGDEVLKKIVETLKEKYKLSKKGFTPWNKQVSFLGTVLSPLQYGGLGEGQIESLNDNENIIPLYCFGLDVFDFDLASKKLKPLVDLANEESMKVVLEFFD